MISNALLRFERVIGRIPKPFSQPAKNMDFWVLEIPVRGLKRHQQLNGIAKVLKAHQATILKYNKGIVRGVLHIAYAHTEGQRVPQKITPEFVHLLSSLGLGLETYED